MVENARIYIDKVKLMDVWAAFFGMIGLGVAMVESKMYYEQVRFDVLDENDNILYESQKSEKEAISLQFLRVQSTASCVITIIAVWAGYSNLRKYLIYKNHANPRVTFKQLGMQKPQLIEAFTLMLHSPPKINFTFEVSQYSEKLVQNSDQILTTLMCIRCYLILRLAARYSRFYSDNIFDLCVKYYVPMDLMFSIKCVLKNAPYKLGGGGQLVSVVIYGFSMQSYEQPFMYYSGQGWDALISGFWCTIITMSTVGYGDFYPTTHVGRFIAIISMIWGQFLISLLLIAMVITASFSSQEEKAYTNIKISAFYNEMAMQCLVCMQHWALGRLLRMGKIPKRFQKVGSIRASRMTEIKLKLAINSFVLMRKTYVSQVMADDVDFMIDKLNTKILAEVKNLKEFAEFGTSITQLVGEVERSTELNLERASWLLNEWIDKYKDLGYRLQVLCHLKPALKYPASKSWKNSEDDCFNPDKTVIAALDLYPKFWNCMEQSIGREKAFLGLTLETPPDFDYEMATIQHHKRYNQQETIMESRRSNDISPRGKKHKQSTLQSKGPDGNKGKSKVVYEPVLEMEEQNTTQSRVDLSDIKVTKTRKKKANRFEFADDLLDENDAKKVGRMIKKDARNKYQTNNALATQVRDQQDDNLDEDNQENFLPKLESPKKKKKKSEKKDKGEKEERKKSKKKKVRNSDSENESDDEKEERKRKEKDRKEMEKIMFKKKKS